MECILCRNKTELFFQIKDRSYFQCSHCHSVMLNTDDYISAEKEKLRYESHNNDVMDERYQKYASPIVKAVMNDYKRSNLGLDFGSGTGPVITKLLRDQGYTINIYDPFFADDKEQLKLKYDYIVCCEVMEHFHNPYLEFIKLHSLLNPLGTLYLKTSLYDDSIDFNAWYYKNDLTHVFFYHVKALEYIKNQCGFKDLIISKDYIIFKKS